jgi:hypothetical protein
LNYIATFLWSIWKARNDSLFGRKKLLPGQIALHTKALLKNLESTPLMTTPSADLAPLPDRIPKQGETISVFSICAGPELFIDAAWKAGRRQALVRAGIGVYLTFTEANGSFCDVLISAASAPVASPIQAEAQGLVLDAELASSLLIQRPRFFSDCINLTRAAASPGASDHAVLWYQKASNPRSANSALTDRGNLPHQKGDKCCCSSLCSSGQVSA